MRDGRKDIALGDRQYWTWLNYTLMYAMLCGPLTSSWVSFLTPTSVDLEFYFTGTQMNYSAAAAPLQANWGGYVAPYPSGSSPLVTYMNATRGLQGYGLQQVSQYTQAGTAAVVNEFGSPYYIPLLDALYNGSTGGVFINHSAMTQDASLSIPSEYAGWTQSYTTFQQGLSAEVHCRQQSFINATDVYPSVDLYSSASLGTSIDGPNVGVTVDYAIQRWLTITNCSSDSVAYTIDILAMVNLTGSALGDGVLIGSICKYQDFEKATNQSFLVLMQGFEPWYSFITPTICEVSPRITSVKVDFDGTTVNINETTNFEPLDPEGQQAVFIDQISDLIWLMTFDTQSISGNSMAAGIQMAIPDSALLNFTLENYLRGAIELLGTFWQLELQQMSDTTMMQYTGIVHVQSMGYEYKRSTSLLLLVPLAVVVILTCVAAVYTPAVEPKKPGKVSLDFSEGIDKGMADPASCFADLENFDPTNIVHLMMLASKTPLPQEYTPGENEVLQFHLK
ncbi:uncharacterized protein EDB91DRAFT_1347587 [Suillus paluster]|uniref:uncharacterized protein n=1 Tax=Suillus paluster TaxID=48578 RepID=UPI001B886BF0|nr:uncharacterized protein EDB91DRAFT_1347587 [Suillus paluster]KAG1738645.1 hypothetical protein EDB91DRAFT_1347587 [Suillus paluster]